MDTLFRKATFVAGLLGINVWSIFMALQSGPSQVVGIVELHPPFFLLLACVGIPVTITVVAVLCGSQIQKVVRKWQETMPKNRFHRLENDSDELFKELTKGGYEQQPALRVGGAVIVDLSPITAKREVPVEIVFSMQKLMYALHKLSVPHPPLDDVAQWIHWLPKLICCAGEKDLKEAKRLDRDLIG